MSGALIDAALAYAARGWPVCPWQARNGRKFPLTEHWNEDATLDPEEIRRWVKRWPDMLVAIVTGEVSGVVALDIDVDASTNVNGWDALDDLGVSFAPVTPMDHTPRGGSHCLFKYPGHFVKTIAGFPGPGLDVRGDGGCLILPPGPGRRWDDHIGLDTPLAPMPEWMAPAEIDEAPRPTVRPRSTVKLGRYGEKALDGAVRRIIEARPGSQETTLNAEVFSIGRLAGGGAIPAGLALDALLWAARQMPSHDARRPWNAADLSRKVKMTFADGLRQPRAVPNG